MFGSLTRAVVLHCGPGADGGGGPVATAAHRGEESAAEAGGADTRGGVPGDGAAAGRDRDRLQVGAPLTPTHPSTSRHPTLPLQGSWVCKKTSRDHVKSVL